MPKDKKKKKKKRPMSIREMRKGASKADMAEAKKSDPIDALDNEWYSNGKKADAWKPKWECMMALMGHACGEEFGKADMPKKFDPNKKAGDVIAFFAKWLNDDGGHIFTRQHILKLLVPFGKTYDKSCWKKANKLAQGIMEKQWLEKKPGFLPLVTPALLGVYEGSGIALKSWKSYLMDAVQSDQPQIRMSAWDFLAKICMIGDISDFNVSNSKCSKDISSMTGDSSLMKILQETMLNDSDKTVRDAGAKFIYGCKQCSGSTGKLNTKALRDDKRAAAALDVAKDNFARDIRILKGLKAPTEEQIKEKQEKKAVKAVAKQKKKRANNMRAMMRAAKKKAKKEGGASEIQIAVMGGGGGGGDSDDDKPKKEETTQEKKT